MNNAKEVLTKPLASHYILYRQSSLGTRLILGVPLIGGVSTTWSSTSIGCTSYSRLYMWSRQAGATCSCWLPWRTMDGSSCLCALVLGQVTLCLLDFGTWWLEWQTSESRLSHVTSCMVTQNLCVLTVWMLYRLNVGGASRHVTWRVYIQVF